ncbi:MAG: ATP-dependent RecD-like DNA helicase [Clostridia bacterium]|nr:ATP-dependent RecD-like DNA helicase [Clostridia bacterium]
MSQIYSGRVSRVIYRSPDGAYTVMELRCDDGSTLVAVGNVPPLAEGEHVEVEGDWSLHKSYGKQLRVAAARPLAPTTTGAIVTYLSSGLIRGVGEVTARRLVEFFGDDTLNVLEKEPERMMDVPGIGKTRYRTIYESYIKHVATRDIFMGLQQYGMTVLQVTKVHKAYGADALRLIKENPYRLIDDIEGIGFKTADDIAMAAGYDRDSAFRLRAGVKHTLICACQDGHTYLPIELLAQKAAAILGAELLPVENTITDMIARGDVICVLVDTTDAVFLPYMYAHESACAKHLISMRGKRHNALRLDLDAEIARLERSFGVELALKQREAVTTALTNGVMVITGGPGTGKTTILRFIKSLLDTMGVEYELCAPTGRAAKRMSASTGSEARTIHRLLESNGSMFSRDETNPIEADVVVIDELSMVDASLMSAVLRAMRADASLILVGDADQLPSVGAGNVLKDIVSSGLVPVVRLEEVYRQSERSAIITNAHAVNRGDALYLNADDEFVFERASEPYAILNRLTALLRTAQSGGAGGALTDIQVLAPMKKGTLGVNNINVTLQQALNPHSPYKRELQYGGGILREGDKVMQVKNDYSMEWKVIRAGSVMETGYGVYNGDLGVIEHIDPYDQYIEVLFDDRLAMYEYSQLDQLSLAYCVSIHKSQGSEFHTVVLPLLSGPPMLMTRNILYTAITRAKDRVYILGREECVRSMIANDYVMRRYSALGYFLSEAAQYDIFA